MPKKSLLSEGLKKSDASRAQQAREGERSSYDLLRGQGQGQGEASRKSFSDLLRHGPSMTPTEEWGSVNVDIDRDTPSTHSGDSARTSLQNLMGEQSENRRHSDNSGPSRKELLKQPFDDLSDLRNHAIQMAGPDRLEPQVKDAVHNLNQKGYETDTSGFTSDLSQQYIGGPFALNSKTKRKLSVMGVEVAHNSKEFDFMRNGVIASYDNYTVIRFATDKNNLRDIEKEWTRVTKQIPSLD